MAAPDRADLDQVGAGMPPGAAARQDDPADETDHQDRWVAIVTAIALLGFSLAWTLVLVLIEQGVYGDARSAVDVGLYRRYAEQVATGLLPYRDFAFEYPPLAIVPIVLPVLLGAPVTEDAAYRHMFELVIAAFGMLTTVMVLWSVAALRRSRRDTLVAALIVAASPVLLGPLLLSRYDLWPALFAAATAWLLVTDRPRWAAVALGLGVLAKVYPVVLAPFALVYLWRTRGRREAAWFAGLTGAVVAIGVAPFLLLATDGIIDAFTRAFRRPLQVESLGAVLLYVREALGGDRVRVVHSFDSYNVRGETAEIVGTVQSVVLVVALVAALWLFARGRPTPDRLVLAFAAALTAWVAFGRVFSPQYLIWLIAPLAIVAGRRWSAAQVLIVVAILLTALYYPGSYVSFYSRHEPMWIAVVLARNLVLATLTVYLVARLRSLAPASRGRT